MFFYWRDISRWQLVIRDFDVETGTKLQTMKQEQDFHARDTDS